MNIDSIAQIGAGGLLAYLILRLVLEHLEKARARKNGNTDFMRKPTSRTDEHIMEIHDALLASPPRESLVSMIKGMSRTMLDQSQKQSETVKVLEQIRDVLKGQSRKIDAAKCKVSESEKKI